MRIYNTKYAYTVYIYIIYILYLLLFLKLSLTSNTPWKKGAVLVSQRPDHSDGFEVDSFGIHFCR